jgi:hypothetical protein
MGLCGQRHAPAALYLRRKDPLYPLDRRLGGLRAGLDAEARRKILCPCLGSNPDRPTRSQTLTAWATAAPALFTYWELKPQSSFQRQSIATVHITLSSLQLWIRIQPAHWSPSWRLSDVGTVRASRHSWPESDWTSRTWIHSNVQVAGVSKLEFVRDFWVFPAANFPTSWHQCGWLKYLQAASPIVISNLYWNTEMRVAKSHLLPPYVNQISISKYLVYIHISGQSVWIWT